MSPRRLVVLFALPALSFGATVGCWSNGFEDDTSGWFTGTNNSYGTITQAASGTGGIPAATGNYFALLTGAPGSEVINGHATNTGAYTWWGGNASVFPASGFTTSLDIYLNTAGGYPSDTRFIFSSSINDQTGSYLNEYFFIGGYYGGNQFVIAANDSASPRTNPINLTLTASGWYTFQYQFFDLAGNLAVDMNVLDAKGNRLQTWNIRDKNYDIASQVGGNGYGWFVTEDFPTLAIDNSELSTPEPATLGFLGLGVAGICVKAIRRARRRALGC
jgi:PEP-CTERM motif